MSQEILHLTEHLLKYNHLFMVYYQKGRETGIKQDFHEVIKPCVNDVKMINDEWKRVTKKWLLDTNHKHLHLKQVDTTSEHIELLSIQAFFSETSKKRFFDVHRTVEYFLLDLIKEVKKEKRDA